MTQDQYCASSNSDIDHRKLTLYLRWLLHIAYKDTKFYNFVVITDSSESSKIECPELCSALKDSSLYCKVGISLGLIDKIKHHGHLQIISELEARGLINFSVDKGCFAYELYCLDLFVHCKLIESLIKFQISKFICLESDFELTKVEEFLKNWVNTIEKLAGDQYNLQTDDYDTFMFILEAKSQALIKIFYYAFPDQIEIPENWTVSGNIVRSLESVRELCVEQFSDIIPSFSTEDIFVRHGSLSLYILLIYAATYSFVAPKLENFSKNSQNIIEDGLFDEVNFADIDNSEYPQVSQPAHINQSVNSSLFFTCRTSLDYTRRADKPNYSELLDSFGVERTSFNAGRNCFKSVLESGQEKSLLDRVSLSNIEEKEFSDPDLPENFDLSKLDVLESTKHLELSKWMSRRNELPVILEEEESSKSYYQQNEAVLSEGLPKNINHSEYPEGGESNHSNLSANVRHSNISKMDSIHTWGEPLSYYELAKMPELTQPARLSSPPPTVNLEFDHNSHLVCDHIKSCDEDNPEPLNPAAESCNVSRTCIKPREKSCWSLPVSPVVHYPYDDQNIPVKGTQEDVKDYNEVETVLQNDEDKNLQIACKPDPKDDTECDRTEDKPESVNTVVDETNGDEIGDKVTERPKSSYAEYFINFDNQINPETVKRRFEEKRKNFGVLKRKSATSSAKLFLTNQVPLKVCPKPRTNKLRILNAIKSVLLPGHVDAKLQKSAIMDVESSRDVHQFMVLLGGGRMKYKAMYAYIGNSAKKISGLGPDLVDEMVVASFYKYDCASRRFVLLDETKSFSIQVDAFSLLSPLSRSKFSQSCQ